MAVHVTQKTHSTHTEWRYCYTAGRKLAAYLFAGHGSTCWAQGLDTFWQSLLCYALKNRFLQMKHHKKLNNTWGKHMYSRSRQTRKNPSTENWQTQHTHTPHVHCTHVYTKVREYRCLALRTAEWWDKDDNANSHKDMLRYMQGSACCTNIDAAVEFREAEKGPPDCGVPHVVHVNCCHPLPFPPPPPPSSPSLRPSPSSCVTLLHITQKTMVTTINHGLLLSTV